MTETILMVTIVALVVALWQEHRHNAKARENADYWCDRADDFRRQLIGIRAERSALQHKLSVLVEDAERIEGILNTRIQEMLGQIANSKGAVND